MAGVPVVATDADGTREVCVPEKTGRLVLASDACTRGSTLQNIAADVSQMGFDSLDAPVTVVGSRNWITPCFELEDTFFP